MGSQTIKPSRWYYGLAALVVLVGVASMVLVLYKYVSGITKSLTQVVAPGKAEITLSEPGTYTIDRKSVV